MFRTLTGMSGRFRSKAFYYYLIPVRMIFYFFVLPVSIEYKQVGHRLMIKTGRLRKIICIILHGILLIVTFLRLIRALRGRKVKENLIKLYDIGQEIISVITMLVWINLCFIKNINNITTLMQNCYRFAQHPNDHYSTISKKERIVILLICFVNTPGIATLHLSNDVGFCPGRNLWDFLKSSGGRLFYSLFLRSSDMALDDDLMTPQIISISAVFGILETYYWIFDSCTLLMCYTTCFLAPRISTEYFAFLRNHHAASFQEMRDSYRDVCSLLGSINDTLGSLILLIFLSAFPYFGKYAVEILDGENWRFKVETAWYMVMFLLIFFFAAEAHTQFQKFPDYIFENQGNLMGWKADSSECLLFLLEVKHTQKYMGLAGGSFFIITHRFMGTFMGTLFTFLIIILQFEAGKHQTQGQEYTFYT